MYILAYLKIKPLILSLSISIPHFCLFFIIFVQFEDKESIIEYIICNTFEIEHFVSSSIAILQKN